MSNKTNISAVEAGIAIAKAAQDKIASYADELSKLQKKEAEGHAKLAKGLYGLPDSTPSDLAIKDGDATKQHAPTRTVFKILAMKKAETFIDNDHTAEHDKRTVEKGKPKGNLPPQLASNWAGKNDSKPEAEINPPGSGGLKKEEGSATAAKPVAPPKPPVAPAVKPQGVPAAKVGTAPSVPKPPKAPGSVGSTMKSEPVGIFKKLKKQA